MLKKLATLAAVLVFVRRDRRIRRERDLARANLTEFAEPAIRETVAAYSVEKLARKRAELEAMEAEYRVNAYEGIHAAPDEESAERLAGEIKAEQGWGVRDPVVERRFVGPWTPKTGDSSEG